MPGARRRRRGPARGRARDRLGAWRASSASTCSSWSAASRSRARERRRSSWRARSSRATSASTSRGALKLEKALETFPVDPAGKLCADLGASTGGFTDLLLQRGARKVYAVDVGYGQLHPKLRADPRVVVRERENARLLTAASLGERVELVVGDLSFISLRLVLPAVRSILQPGGDVILLVKPQFEVGKGEVGKGGVVREDAKRRSALEGVKAAAVELGFAVVGEVESPIEGPAGNREWLLALRAPGLARGAPPPSTPPSAP